MTFVDSLSSRKFNCVLFNDIFHHTTSCFPAFVQSFWLQIIVGKDCSFIQILLQKHILHGRFKGFVLDSPSVMDFRQKSQWCKIKAIDFIIIVLILVNMTLFWNIEIMILTQNHLNLMIDLR